MSPTLRARARTLSATSLDALHRDPDAITLKEFASALHLSPSAGWGILKRLVQAGLAQPLARGVYRLLPPPSIETQQALRAYRQALCRDAEQHRHTAPQKTQDIP